MSVETVNKLLHQKENIRLEFKEAKSALPTNLFESICSMLNRDGGDILLGVSNNGKVVGIDAEALETMVTNIVNLSNNPQKIDPPFILFPMKLRIQEKNVLHIQIPSSSQIHKSAGIIFDRSADGDFKVVNPAQIADLYNKKRTHFTENTLYPFLKFSDFKSELFPKIRNLIRSNNPNHPWLALNDEQMLEKAGLWKFDFQTGESGYTLAAALLLGKDEVIQQILPHYKIDALVRIHDEFRYDDRVYIQTNLIEAYEQLMDFVGKHLPDKFFQTGDQRISLRTHIFREIVANIIVHREYTNAHPCTFVIKKGKVETENANNAHGEGFIDLLHFVPFPKNPTLAKFFIQLGRVDELGSGVINVNRYIQEYAENGKPTFAEGNTFKMTIPISTEEAINTEYIKSIDEAIGGGVEEAIDGAIGRAIDGAIDGVTKGVNEKLSTLLKAIGAKEGKRAPEYIKAIDVSERTMARFLQQLKNVGLIEFRGEAPQTGGYYLTKKLKAKPK
ncbi:MAG: putative DNA binding domain-containing protein [Bacteroidetes bacterium]|nr:putative DNA binding domain-containing protein [Bacteroidota bacterium]